MFLKFSAWKKKQNYNSEKSLEFQNKKYTFNNSFLIEFYKLEYFPCGKYRISFHGIWYNEDLLELLTRLFSQNTPYIKNNYYYFFHLLIFWCSLAFPLGSLYNLGVSSSSLAPFFKSVKVSFVSPPPVFISEIEIDICYFVN